MPVRFQKQVKLYSNKGDPGSQTQGSFSFFIPCNKQFSDMCRCLQVTEFLYIYISTVAKHVCLLPVFGIFTSLVKLLLFSTNNCFVDLLDQLCSETSCPAYCMLSCIFARISLLKQNTITVCKMALVLPVELPFHLGWVCFEPPILRQIRVMVSESPPPPHTQKLSCNDFSRFLV